MSAAVPAAAVVGRTVEIPTSVRQALLLARYQLRDYLRSRRFVLMLGIVAALGGVITLVVGYYRPAALLGSPDVFYGGPWAGGVGILIVFAGIIFGGDAIAGEFQNRTGYFLMGLPVRRAAVYAGKYLAAFAAASVCVLVYLAVNLGNAAFYFGGGALSDPSALGASLGLALLYLLALLGTVFLFSSMFKQSLYGVIVVAVMFLIGWTLVQAVIVGLTRTEPWYLISYAALVLPYPLTGAPPHAIPVPGGAIYSPTVAEGVAIFLGYFVGTTLAGLALFEREEFT